jgi:VWFA-related protein
MRLPALLILLVCPAVAQFKSTVPLVVSPTTITDAKGQPVDGLTARDLNLYDNNVPQAIQVEELFDPVSLVVAVEASTGSISILDKLGRSGVLFSDLIAAEGGETAVLSFASDVKLVQDFTADSTRLSRTVRAMRSRGDGVALLDAVGEALRLLAARDPSRRRILLMIAERRDRSSKTDIATLLRNAQLEKTTVYWLTFSTFLAQYTNRRKTVWDRMTDEQKEDPKRMHSSKIPLPEEEEPLPPDLVPGSLLTGITELFHKTTVDAATLLSRTTGGRTFSFMRQDGLENAIQAVGQEVHRQYIVTFQPRPDEPGRFHSIHAEVKGRPELHVRTRAGYWSAGSAQ